MKKLYTFLSLVGLAMIVMSGAAMAQPPSKERMPLDTMAIDISWPQCGDNLGVNNRPFVIVGVNGGLATTTNPCLSQQLTWGNQAKGSLNQPKLQLYVNTANPGGLNTASWPRNNVDPVGTTTSNPYGTCNGSDSLPCAWQYGWNRAVEAAQMRFKPAAVSAGVSSNPGDYLWWLDVETENTWKEGGTFAYQSNVADLEGMTSYFESLLSSAGTSAEVGLYSTGYQWNYIVGSAVSATSNLTGLRSWLAGANLGTRTQDSITFCSKPPLTVGGTVSTIQYIPKGVSLDYNTSCYRNTQKS